MPEVDMTAFKEKCNTVVQIKMGRLFKGYFLRL